jgi:hypothetical protein
MIEEDSDGNPAMKTWVVDISRILSEQLGKQMSMTSTYRVKGLHVSLRNVDNTNDNNYGITCGGRVQWYTPTKHRIDAIQYAREYMRDLNAGLRSDDGSPFAPYADQKSYRGLRFNWDADGQVRADLEDETSVLPGDNWSLYNILHYYNRAKGGDPSDEGYLSDGTMGSALWNTRTGTNDPDSMYWNAGYRNSALQDIGDVITSGIDQGIDWIFQPESHPWDWDAGSANHLPVLGGLMRFTFDHTNTDNPRFGDVNDEYYLQVSIMIEGWEEF